ncbi:unnamed protein product [Thelazia callipaeda]|uniref:Cyclin_C domain-containing protein n=1 Tax=Thelazia callipaeda TaxID=103827 RepID=A0A0N5D6M8_THECL|nr:unnamed protein product [Thelazia callipaeda]
MLPLVPLKEGRHRVGKRIIIYNPHALNIPERLERVLILDGIEFPVDGRQMILTSTYLRRIFMKGYRTVIDLNHLKEEQPCFDTIGLKIAIAYAQGCVKIPFNQIVSALAAAYALEIKSMRCAINEELCRLAAKPKTAPFAIEFACQNMREDKGNWVVRHALLVFNEVIKRRTYSAMSAIAYRRLISLYLLECSRTMDKSGYPNIAKWVTQGVMNWCSYDNGRCMTTIHMFDKLRTYCDKNLISEVEKQISQENPQIDDLRPIFSGMLKGKLENVSHDYGVSNYRAAAGRSHVNYSRKSSDSSIKSFHEIKLPEVEPDADGVRHYKFKIELQTSKEFLASRKPKIMDLDLKALLEIHHKEH